MNRRSEFIPGIEGLRAIAIIAVLINHLNSEFFPGGYLGVDLFFVISGFVVSRSLDTASNVSLTNYLAEFYSKRLKRLFPALLLSYILITLVATFFFDGLGKSTLRTGGAALLGLSNLYLIRINTDYFGLGSEFNLFLPTWSLGVEEQFYFFFPFFLFWLKSKKRTIVGWHFVVVAISFVVFVSFHYTSKNYQYYFPLSRLWELLIGSLLYFYAKNHNYNLKNKWIIPMFLVLLFLTFFITDSYFSIAAPLVCLISAGLIYATTKTNSVILNNPLMLYIGKISYSVYLYHFAVLKLINPGSSWGMLLLCLIVIFVVSIASFHFVETPIRKIKWKNLNAHKIISFSAAIVTASLLILVSTRHIAEKDPFMRPTKTEYRIEPCNYSGKVSVYCKLPSEGYPRLFFMGDSHSNALSPVMLELHNTDQYEVHSIASNGLMTTTMEGLTRKYVQVTANSGLDFILNNIRPGDTVIMTNQLMTWFSHTLNDDPELHRLTFDGKVLSHKEALLKFASEQKEIARILKKKQANLIITAPFPDFPVHPVKCYSPLKIALGLETLDRRCQTTRVEQEERRNEIILALNRLSSEESNIKIFDPIDLICNESVCDSYKTSKPIYYDDDHINFNLSPHIYTELISLIK